MVNEELKARQKLALATLKANKEIQLKKIRASTLSRNKQISQLKSFQIGQQLNSEQGFLQEMFGSGQRCMMPSEETLPPATINHSLMPNFGGIEEDDGYTTANNFGMGRFKSETGGFFGI